MSSAKRLGQKRRRASTIAIALLFFAALSSPLWVFSPLWRGRDAVALGGASCAARVSDAPEGARRFDVPADAPGADDARFTIVLNTFRRRDLLKLALEHYRGCDAASIAEIHVVWSEQTDPPRETDANAAEYFASDRPGFVRYDAFPTTSIQNRFAVRDVRTAAVFNVDDDVRIPCDALARGFDAWKHNRDVLVGYYPRATRWNRRACRHDYVWDDVSMFRESRQNIVLTKAAFSAFAYLRLYDESLPAEARAYVDERKNCEDIAMQILTSHVSRKPPVYVATPRWFHWRAKLEGLGVAGISKGRGHHELRGGCVTDLSRLITGRGVGRMGRLSPLSEQWGRYRGWVPPKCGRLVRCPGDERPTLEAEGAYAATEGGAKEPERSPPPAPAQTNEAGIMGV